MAFRPMSGAIRFDESFAIYRYLATLSHYVHRLQYNIILQATLSCDTHPSFMSSKSSSESLRLRFMFMDAILSNALEMSQEI